MMILHHLDLVLALILTAVAEFQSIIKLTALPAPRESTRGVFLSMISRSSMDHAMSWK
jgi:hypothetical protein